MERVVFEVQGSGADPYLVTFIHHTNGFTATCTCPAGLSRQSCKHRVSILGNSQAGVVSSNASDVAVVFSWLPGSTVEAALNSLAQAEKEQERAKKAVSVAKRAVASAMHAAP